MKRFYDGLKATGESNGATRIIGKNPLLFRFR